MIHNRLAQIRSWLEQRAPRFTLSYHGYKIKLPFNPRTGRCSVCGKRGFTNMHHCCYNFSRREVKVNPTLGLLFTFEVCFGCHELANSIRKLLFEHPELELKTSNKKLNKIYENHLKIFSLRDEFNKNRVENIQKEYKFNGKP